MINSKSSYLQRYGKKKKKEKIFKKKNIFLHFVTKSIPFSFKLLAFSPFSCSYFRIQCSYFRFKRSYFQFQC